MKIWIYLVVIVIVFLLGYWTAKYQIGRSVKEVFPEKPAKAILQDTQWTGPDQFVVFDTAVIDVVRNTGFEKSFKDFRVPIYKGKKSVLNQRSAFVQNHDAIAYQYNQQQMNFAGHYIFTN